MHKLSTLMRPIQAAAFLLAAAAMPSHAADLLVRLSGLAEPLGQVGCTLFAGPAGFPMDSSSARVIWLPADVKGVVCRFNDLPEGRYAVSVGHDINGNKKVDTNVFGIPTEQWGVSNNIRPSLRAPRFDEAAFSIPADGKELSLEIKVAK
jgi:uncharacterized protein (DUF2141 family)